MHAALGLCTAARPAPREPRAAILTSSEIGAMLIHELTRRAVPRRVARTSLLISDVLAANTYVVPVSITYDVDSDFLFFCFSAVGKKVKLDARQSKSPQKSRMSTIGSTWTTVVLFGAR
jgi:hypothetical protein